MADDNGNGRVTIALIGQKLDSLAQAFDEDREERRAILREHAERLRMLETHQGILRSKLANSQIGQSGLAIVLSAVAAWLGMRN